MIDAPQLLTTLKALTAKLVEDLTQRSEQAEAVLHHVRGEYARAQSAGRTDRSYVEWREDLLNQVAVAWVLGTVFVRFCEDNGLVDDPLLSGSGERRRIAQDHRLAWLTERPQAGDREWLEEVFHRYQALPATAGLFAETNPLWQVGPSADGARALLDVWWDLDATSGELSFDFADQGLDTRFLGDLYQDLSDHAKKTYALLQTPEFVESFILDRTLDPAIEEFGLEVVKMIDPTCGSGHFLLGSFDRLFRLWQEREPATPARELAQRALNGVHGVDLNPFAVAVARFRLLVAVLKASDIGRLAGTPVFEVHVATGDSLLHGTQSSTLFASSEAVGRAQQHHYATEDAEATDRILRAGTYHAVVGNPPYITVKDKAANGLYRALYKTCHRQYSLGVPFTERFWDLAVEGRSDLPAGYVGMITANSFMKREFGKKLIETWLPQRDLTHVIDTSGAYIPGHGTPTVILFGRRQPPVLETVRAVLGIRGEPGKPEDPANGLVWTSIQNRVAAADTEDEFTSSEDVVRSTYGRHPWSLQGGAAPSVFGRIVDSSTRFLAQESKLIGSTVYTRSDDAFLAPSGIFRRLVGPESVMPFATGSDVRDWACSPANESLFPYTADQPHRPTDHNARAIRLLWANRTSLWERREPNGSVRELGMRWYEWARFLADRHRTPLSIVFPFVATHNHFALDRGGKVFNRHAPVIKLSETATEADHLRLLGLLNSSTACFWMKQTFFVKGKMSSGTGGVVDEAWEPFYEFDGTKLKLFPIPSTDSIELPSALDEAGRTTCALTPAAVISRSGPSRSALEDAQKRWRVERARMVALQEELDWDCYARYDLTDAPLTARTTIVPHIERGHRAFEILLARQIAAGHSASTWFRRHDAKPITQLPAEWPDEYRRVVQTRLDLIESDRAISLLERPEYKRRWAPADKAKPPTPFNTWRDQLIWALRDWLRDRLESPDAWGVELTTTARLAERFRGNAEFLEAAQIYTDSIDVNLADLVRKLVLVEAVPYLADLRYKPSGIKKRKAWEETWDLQRAEDAIAEREDLTDEDKSLLKKQQNLTSIPVPPKYASKDFAKTSYWKLRGKLDVPKERFILYPGTRLGSDSSPVIGWAGWNHLEQAQALAAHYTRRQSEAAEPAELRPLLAGLAELVPWLKQWHNDLDPTYGQRLGDFYAAFVDAELL